MNLKGPSHENSQTKPAQGQVAPAPEKALVQTAASASLGTPVALKAATPSEDLLKAFDPEEGAIPKWREPGEEESWPTMQEALDHARWARDMCGRRNVDQCLDDQRVVRFRNYLDHHGRPVDGAICYLIADEAGQPTGKWQSLA